MGRKTQITKEKMLQAAYEILKEEGYLAVNIKSIAARAGCSTQPISWQFGNMQGLRRELFLYANSLVFDMPLEEATNKNAMELFYESGKKYITNAYEIPKVFRFLCVDDPSDVVGGNHNIVDFLGNDLIKEKLSSEFGISGEAAKKIVADIVIYTHGLAAILMWESVSINKQEAYEMIYNHARNVFSQFDIDVTKYVSPN